MKSYLILGGARSGKSRYAVELAAQLGGPVLFVATATAGDEEMRERITTHKKQRPAGWRTLEAPLNIGMQIERNVDESKVVIVDCITLLAGNVIGQQSNPENPDASLAEKQNEKEISSLIQCIKKVDAAFIIVSNEVGLGLVPDNPMGRVYRDVLGKANQMLAQAVDEVYFMVAGLRMVVKSAGDN